MRSYRGRNSITCIEIEFHCTFIIVFLAISIICNLIKWRVLFTATITLQPGVFFANIYFDNEIRVYQL